MNGIRHLADAGRQCAGHVGESVHRLDAQSLLAQPLHLVLLGIEWMLLNKAAKEQAAKLHRAPVLDAVARTRIATMARFAAVLPFAFAFFFWYIWG